jgi:hypothetical protein
VAAVEKGKEQHRKVPDGFFGHRNRFSKAKPWKNNPEVVWFKSHPRNHEKTLKTIRFQGFSFFYIVVIYGALTPILTPTQ